MCVVASAMVLVVGTAPAVRTQTPAMDARPVLTQYCFTCHNDRLKTGGLSLEALDLAKIGDSPDVWEKVVRRLRTGAMPPPSSRRPDQATYDRLTGWLEGELDRHAAAHPNPGRPAVHRLNRSEYANAIRDLLDLNVNVSSLLPPDDSAFGFDNVADVLGVSPVLLERYLNAADEISALAVGDPDTSPGSESYHVRHDLSQDQHVEGLPLGTVGGTLIRHNFPLDATYVIQVKLLRTNLNAIRGMEWEQQLEISVDGQRVHLAPIGGRADLLLLGQKPDHRQRRNRHAASGSRADQGGPALGGRHVRPAVAGARHRAAAAVPAQLGRHVRTDGPAARPDGERPRAVRRDRARRHAQPAADFHVPSRQRQGRSGCARTILSTLARRAYRRPLAKGEIEPLMAFFEAGRRDGTFDSGHSAGAAAHPRHAEVRVPHRTGPGGHRAPASRTGSAISSWRRACRSSSGAAFPTTSC